MNEIIKAIEDAQKKEQVPEFRIGDTVRVHCRIKEGNHERIQIFEGVVIKRQGGSSRETFTVRKTSSGIGVERRGRFTLRTSRTSRSSAAVKSAGRSCSTCVSAPENARRSKNWFDKRKTYGVRENNSRPVFF